MLSRAAKRILKTRAAPEAPKTEEVNVNQETLQAEEILTTEEVTAAGETPQTQEPEVAISDSPEYREATNRFASYITNLLKYNGGALERNSDFDSVAASFPYPNKEGHNWTLSGVVSNEGEGPERQKFKYDKLLVVQWEGDNPDIGQPKELFTLTTADNIIRDENDKILVNAGFINALGYEIDDAARAAGLLTLSDAYDVNIRV